MPRTVYLYVPPRNRALGSLDGLALVGVLGFAVARWVPIATMIPFWGCSWRKLTGWPCPGCGLTRVADRFAHLHWWGAFQANPLGTLAAGGFAMAIVVSALHLTLGMPVPELVLSDREWARARWVAVAAIILNYAFVAFSYRVWHWR